MGHALKCGQGWLTGVGSGWTEKKPYKVRDLPRERGSEGGGGRPRFLLLASSESDQMGVHNIGQGARSVEPWAGPSLCS